MARGKGLSLDLLEQLTFYGSYHHNRWNQLIHFVFVPSIIWSIMVGLAYIGPLLQLAPEHLQFLPALVRDAVVLNAPCLVAAMYSVFYICLEPFAGISWAVCMGLPLWLTSTAFQMKVADAWAWALGVQVFSWYMQIHPGHGILEKRKPALLDSLVQAFALAPLFVWFELLFALGYRPQLYAQLQLRVQKNIAEWRAKHLLQAPLLDEGTRQE